MSNPTTTTTSTTTEKVAAWLALAPIPLHALDRIRESARPKADLVGVPLKRRALAPAR